MSFKKAVILAVSFLSAVTWLSAAQALPMTPSASVPKIGMARWGAGHKSHYAKFDLDGLEQGAPGTVDSSIC